MLLKVLKSNRSSNLLLFPLIGILVWLKNIINPKSYSFYNGEYDNVLYDPIHNLLANSTFLQSIIALTVVVIIAFLVQQLNGTYSFIRIRTLLPAPLYVLIIGGFTNIHTLHPVYFAAVFFTIAISRLFSIFEKPKPYSAIFDAGFLMGIGALFYFNMIVIFPAFLFTITILTRDYRWREYIICILGFTLPFLFALSAGILQDQFLELIKMFQQNLITPNNHFKGNIPLQIFAGFLIILTFLGSFKIIQQYDTKKVSTRKYFSSLFFMFSFALSGLVFVPAISQEMLLIMAIPVTFLISNYFVFLKSNFWGEFIFTLLIGLVIYMQIVAL